MVAMHLDGSAGTSRQLKHSAYIQNNAESTVRLRLLTCSTVRYIVLL